MVLPLLGAAGGMLDPFAAAEPQMCVSCCRRSGTARNTPLHSVVCGPCWFATGGDTSPTELTGRPCVVDSELPRTARDWLRAVLASPWFAQRRSDSAKRLRAMLATLARHADWDDHTTWPTWERLMATTGWSRSTMSSWLAELQRRGWLLRVETGSTPRFRPMALHHVEGNRAAVYQLRVPVAVQGENTARTRTPTTLDSSLTSEDHVVPTRARKFINSCVSNRRTVPSHNNGPDGPTGSFFDLRVPVTAGQMLAAATELRRADRALARLTPRWIRSLMAQWWRSGWTNADLLHALGHAPTTGGSRRSDRCPAAQLRRPDGWVRHRLGRWLEGSTPMPPPRLWEHTRQQVAARHGGAGAMRLPYGADALSPRDLAPSHTDRAEAAEQLVRRWAREFHDRRDAPTPPELVADRGTARALWIEVCSKIGNSRGRSSPGTVGSRPGTPEEPPELEGSAELSTSERIYLRALEVARAEGRAARPRRSRR